MNKASQRDQRVTPLRVPVIDLGCGRQKTPGSFGVDQAPLENVDLVWNLLDFPYPFESNSAEQIISQHTLEHFAPDDVLRILAEIYRVLKPGGTLTLTCPHAFSVGAMLDPTHKSFWTFRSFDYFDRRYPYSYYATAGFHFETVARKAFINLWFRWDRPPRWKQWINAALSRMFNWLLAHSETLPDVLIKVLPFYRVDIFVTLRKGGDD